MGCIPVLKEAVRSDALIKNAVREALLEWDAPQNDTSDDNYTEYRRYILRKRIFIGICIVAIFLVSGYALTIGGYDIGFTETYQIIWNHISGK